MFVNDECSSWHNRADNYLVSVWDRTKQLLYSYGSKCRAHKTIPLQSVWSMALIGTMVKCEQFIHSFNVKWNLEVVNNTQTSVARKLKPLLEK